MFFLAYVTVAARLPRDVEEKLERVMREEDLDRSAAVRKILEIGVREWLKEKALDLLRKEKVSLAKAAELAEVSLWEMIELVKERRAEYIRMTQDELEKELGVLRARRR